MFVLIDSCTITQARHTDIITFFERYSNLIFVGHGSGYRCKQHPSLAVKADRRSWYWHSKGVGGYGCIDYLMKVEGIPFRDAVEVLGAPCFAECSPPKTKTPAKSKTLLLPEKAKSQSGLFDYLCRRRGIGKEIVDRLIQEKMLYADVRGNIVFVGYDENGKPRFAALRGTGKSHFRYDCAGSDKRYSFNMTFPESAVLHIFESAIDAMSHATLENIKAGNRGAWLHQNRLSLSGTTDTALQKYLELHPAAKELIFCLDNDRTGREAAISLARKYFDKGYITRIELPLGKDFNDDLLKHTKIERMVEWQN